MRNDCLNIPIRKFYSFLNEGKVKYAKGEITEE